MYSIIHVSGIVEKMSFVDKLILTVACIGHDLDHPGKLIFNSVLGYNNAYMINGI
jgi:high affinity cGMP-specific 3',5'-cyclic phosphodiesterase 9